MDWVGLVVWSCDPEKDVRTFRSGLEFSDTAKNQEEEMQKASKFVYLSEAANDDEVEVEAGTDV